MPDIETTTTAYHRGLEEGQTNMRKRAYDCLMQLKEPDAALMARALMKLEIKETL